MGSLRISRKVLQCCRETIPTSMPTIPTPMPNAGFPTSRGLSQRGKVKREEKDLCRCPTSFLSRMRSRFLNNIPVTFLSRATQPREPV